MTKVLILLRASALTSTSIFQSNDGNYKYNLLSIIVYKYYVMNTLNVDQFANCYTFFMRGSKTSVTATSHSFLILPEQCKD